MHVIGIDIGTTSICGVRFDCDSGLVEDSLTLSNDSELPSSHPWERLQDPEKIRQKVDCLLGYLKKGPISAIGLTGQMHGMLYLDASGKALSPLFTWQDQRGEEPYQDTTYAAALGSMTGYGHVTDFYNRVNGLVPSGAMGFCTIHDYIAMSLCGLSQPVLHTSDAASFGLFDLEKNQFQIDFFYEVTDQCRILGYHDGIPVAVAIGDNQASFLGSGSDADTVLVNVGTGSQISMMTHEMPGQLPPGMEIRPLTNGDRLIVGSSLCGGRALALLHEFYCEIAEMATGERPQTLYPQMDRMLEQVQSSSLRVDTAFSGTRAEPQRRGSISGITTNNLNPKELTMGLLCGEVEELYEMYEQLGHRAGRLVGSGNGIRHSRALQRQFEMRFSLSLQITRFVEEAACGAALFAMVAAGVLPDFASALSLIEYDR